MDEFIYIGKIVSTHGIKGELKILSDSDIKDKVFKINQPIYIGKNKDCYTINSYRKHKNYDLISLVGYENINLVLDLKNTLVYVKRSQIDVAYVIYDLIGFKVIENNKLVGKIDDIIFNQKYYLFKVGNFYIPNVDEYVINIDSQLKEVHVQNIKGLII